ncbi:Nucleoside-diphosphate-sugar epimerase [Cystobacter fuscus DSM 2262]|uniref:Nucleoside-diphosphate-sugar epimerase n=1 Tax=Cystobacter fuscus (strain ATCC 25194 / DSM 2262 / NBRC 100088 / M29) TaxID=1242864 RepID=S9QDF4_CYSF2|nr:NAD-dependent epimerase/dehydratase family protein [Cystobacter fuscus]EPX59384.1 Nucleoside-diphosphate-sugar epimerase [Cystobacter fuscus DSM 2262]
MAKEKIALVLGATGGVGGETAAALLSKGWKVRALHRGAQAGGRHARLEGAEWIRGDALRAEDVIQAARGAQLVVHAVNPPGYREWEKLVLPMLESSLQAARQAGARLVLPGTLYNYGLDAFPLLKEDSPQHPHTRKGKIRVAMERRIEEEAARGTRALIVRAGDFFGPHAGNNWFSQGFVKPGARPRSITNPNVPGVGHAWAYLPDLAATLAALAEREQELPAFERFHFGGHWLEDGAEMSRSILRVLGHPAPPVRRMPWALMRLASPFNTTLRELLEMRYLWQHPARLDNTRLRAFLGQEPHTPLDAAVHHSLQAMGCLPDATEPTPSLSAPNAGPWASTRPAR